jgi:hypothetical protein
LASFSKSRTMISCKSLKPDGSLEYHEKIPRTGVDLYLYDGPPDKRQPDDSGKLIIVTGPNFAWFNDIDRDHFHRTRYMPNWEFAALIKSEH